MPKKFSGLSAVVGLSLAANACLASDNAGLSKAEGLVMLDYQVLKVAKGPSIDLMGFHFLNKLNDWMYLGVGGYAPLFRGEYGGFMAFDATAQVQHKIYGNWFADAGLSVGAGGGGKSLQQSKELSGSGGFVKSYVGLGYDFKDFSVGANVAKMKFTKSTIDSTQLNVFVQIPFSYTLGSYASSGERLPSANESGGALSASGENILTLGLDQLSQIRPEGLNKDTIGVVDLQFSHFFTANSYWYADLGVGYHGLPLYNQILAGLGYRFPVSSHVNLYSQLAIGSGGYAPETIDTGPGLLVYPKVSAEYMLSKNLGASLSAGYLWAPKGSSKNYTVGAALNYHIHSGAGGSGANDGGGVFRGFRFDVFQQTESNVSFRDKARDNIHLLSVQMNGIASDHLYIPVQASVAYTSYLGYPGYGELLAGVGVQSKYEKNDRFQWFGQVLAGANVHGGILKTGVGVNVGLSDSMAIYGLVGKTIAADKDKFKSDYVGFGLTHRFSVPSW